MAVIDYVDETRPETRELVAAIKERRGEQLLNLDRMLLHSPPFAEGWNALLRNVRTRLSLPGKLRELAICAIAVINRADYEFRQHAPEFLAEGGSQRQLEALKSEDGRIIRQHFDATELDVLQLTDEMTRMVQVSAKTLEKVRKSLDNDRQLTEIIGVIATYNMVSRYLVALGIETEQPTERIPAHD